MKLNDLVQTNHWLSVEFILLELYPDVKETIEEHKNAYKKLEQLHPEDYDMEIVLTKCEDNFNGELETYIDVSGRKTNTENTESYALEFTEWKKWLGMTVADETIKNFSELEILAHCLYEMTFIDYEENEIQEQFNNINKTAEDFKKLTEEKKS